MSRLWILPAFVVLVLALVPAMRGSAQAPAGPSPAVTEELIAEKDAAAPEDDNEDLVSADGRHAAWRTGRESKWAVMLDGQRQAGEFEEVKSLAFSGGGQHLAFAARRGEAWMIVLDGKVPAQTFEDVDGPIFSPNGARMAYSAKRDKKWATILDGKVPEVSYDKIGRAMFSEDGVHAAVPAKRGGKWVVFVDAKVASPQFDEVEKVMFSPDGQHLACVGFRGGKRIVALDGKEGQPFDAVVGLTFSRDSRRFGYEGAEIKSAFMLGNRGKGRVVVDGEPGPQYEGSQLPLSVPDALDATVSSGLVPLLLTRSKLDPAYASYLFYRFHGVSRPAFSPDGARLAYAARRDKNDEVVFVDGQAGQRYQSIVGIPVFSGDSRHVAFAVLDAGVVNLVVDGEKLGDCCSAETDFIDAITFAPDSHRIAYVGVTGGSNHKKGLSARAKRCVYVDGLTGPQYDALGISDLRFSPDSRHVAYLVRDLEEGSRHVSFVVTDGVEGQHYDAVYPGTVIVLDTGVTEYTARAGRRFLRVTQSLR